MNSNNQKITNTCLSRAYTKYGILNIQKEEREGERERERQTDRQREREREREKEREK